MPPQTHVLEVSLLILLFLFIELEWMLAEAGAVKTELTEDPRKKNKIHDVMESSLRQTYTRDSDSDEDD